MRRPTDKDGIQDPRSVRGRLYVPVLVHGLYGWSHVEGIHFALEKHFTQRQTTKQQSNVEPEHFNM